MQNSRRKSSWPPNFSRIYLKTWEFCSNCESKFWGSWLQLLMLWQYKFNVGAICYPDWNSWRIMLPSALKLFVNTPQVIEKLQNLPIRKSKWKQNSNLENQVALPKVLCQNCPKMIHTNINKTNRLSLHMAKTIWV